jgi:Cdc6-like AAA superfamily ATPase
MAAPPRELDNWTTLWNEIAQAFSPGAPIDESDLFAGRVDQLRDLINAVNQRGQHAIVFGERGVGKTSLANIFTNYVHSPVSHILATRINCDGVTNFQSLWQKVFSEFGIQTTVDKSTGPDDVRRILAGLSANDLPIIIFDEFDRIAPGKTKGLLADTIKGLSDHSVRATIVIVGVADSVTELLAEHASIGRALVEVPMPRMSDEEIEEILDKRLGRLNMIIDLPVRDRIVRYSQGLPHYAHLIGLHSCQSAAHDHSIHVTNGDLNAAVHNCISKAQQRIRDSYHRATSSPRPDNLFKQVLLACSLAKTDSLGFFAASDVVKPLTQIMGRRYDIPSFARHLKEFCSAERGSLLERRGAARKFRYRFKDPLLQPYITMDGVDSGLLPLEYQ